MLICDRNHCDPMRLGVARHHGARRWVVVVRVVRMPVPVPVVRAVGVPMTRGIGRRMVAEPRGMAVAPWCLHLGRSGRQMRRDLRKPSLVDRRDERVLTVLPP